MSHLLIEDRPMMFLPQLAKALGSCERALVLQQIHWLSRQPHSGVWSDGYHWVWGTYNDWASDYFTMWSPHTLTKHIRKLEQMGVLVSAQLRAHEHDHTKFYRIDYRRLDAKLPDQVASNRPDPVASDPPDPVASNPPDPAASIKRTETSAENTQRGGGAPGAQGGKGPRKNYRPDEYADLIAG